MTSEVQETQQVRQTQRTRQTVRSRRTTARAGDEADSRAAVNRIARAWLLGALVAGIGVGLFVRFYGTQFEYLSTTDGINAAQVARSVAQGRGLKTGVVYPLHMAIGEAGSSRHDIAVGPLYALGLGMFFKGRGAEDEAVALFNGLLLFGTAAFLYALINLVFDRAIALWAVLAYFVSMEAISQALGAGGGTMGGLMVTASLYFAMLAVSASRKDPTEGLDLEEPTIGTRLKLIYRSPWPWTVAAGIAVGLSYLTGVVGIIALAGVIWIAGRQENRSRTALIVAAVLAVVIVAPWLVRNFRHFGSPTAPLNRYSLLSQTDQYPGRSFMWQTSGVPDSPELWALSNPAQMLKKVGLGLTGFYRRLPNIVNSYLFPFLLLGLFTAADTSRRRLLWGGFWFILLAQVLTTVLYTRDAEALAVMTPLGTALAVAALIVLLRNHLHSRRALLGVGALAIAVAVWPYAASSIIGGGGPQDPSKPSLDLIAGRIPKEATIATDTPWQVAWYGGNRAILLPNSMSQLVAMAQAGVEPHIVYLSRDLRTGQPEAGWKYWSRMVMAGEGVDKLPLLGKAQMLPNGEALLTLNYAKPIIDEIQRRAQAADDADGGADASSPDVE